MIEKNVKKFKIVEGEIRLPDILKKNGTFVTNYDNHYVYNYKSNTIIKQDNELTIAGTIGVSVNYAALELNHCGIKLEEITDGNKKY